MMCPSPTFAATPPHNTFLVRPAASVTSTPTTGPLTARNRPDCDRKDAPYPHSSFRLDPSR